MSRKLIFIASLAMGLTLFFSSCGNDEEEVPSSIDIPLAFLSPMAAGDYTVKVTITAPDLPNQITSEQNLAIVEGANRTYDVTVDNIPVGSKRAVKVQIFKAAKRLFEGAGVVNISSGKNQLALRMQKVAELLSSDPAAGAQMLGTGSLTLNFSAFPGTVTVNGTRAVVRGNSASWTAPGLTAGATTLNITWTAVGGGSHTLPMVMIGSPATIIIDPGSATLTAIGETVQLISTIKDSKGQTVSGATVTWKSSNSTVASVSAAGLVTARDNGTATITATSGGKSTDVPITVTQSAASLTVTPASVTLVAIGETVQLGATIKDEKDQTITGATVSWSSNNSAVASVNATGLVAARDNGTATITATSGDKSTDVPITVTQSAASLTVTPASVTLVAIGETVQLGATVKDGKDQTITGATVSWSSNNSAVASVNATGLVTARDNGTATVTATSGDKSTDVPITVTQSAASLTVTPASVTLVAIGETVQLGAVVKDEKDQTITRATVIWSSNNPAVVNVSPLGLVTARRNGRATITATSGGKTATTTITVAQASATIAVTPDSAVLRSIGQTAQLRATVLGREQQSCPPARRSHGRATIPQWQASVPQGLSLPVETAGLQ